MNRNKIPSISIGIPAHNEEAGIGSVVSALLSQFQSGYSLKEIIIYCDSCTDNTYTIAASLAKTHSCIRVFASKERMGKSAVLNAIFEKSTGDISVLLDADTLPVHPLMLSRLIGPFDNPEVGIVSGNDQPYPETHWFAEISKTAYEIWFETRKAINGGDSIHNVHGPIYALRDRVYKGCIIPSNIDADDHFVYLRAKELGFRHVFAKNAQLYFKAPSNLHEYLVQHSRYLQSTDLIVRHFGTKVLKWYAVPRSAKIRGIITVGRKKPFQLIAAMGLQVLLRILKGKYTQKKNHGQWEAVASTKNVSWGNTYAANN